MIGLIIGAFGVFAVLLGGAEFIGDSFVLAYNLMHNARVLWEYEGFAGKVIAIPVWLMGAYICVASRAIWYGIFIAIAGGVLWLVWSVITSAIWG